MDFLKYVLVGLLVVGTVAGGYCHYKNSRTPATSISDQAAPAAAAQSDVERKLEASKAETPASISAQIGAAGGIKVFVKRQDLSSVSTEELRKELYKRAGDTETRITPVASGSSIASPSISVEVH